MNVNGARFQMLLGAADWGRCLDGDGAGAISLAARWQAAAGQPLSGVALPAWDPARQELTLCPLPIALPATAGEQPLSLLARRSAAADRYGNVYRIDETRLLLLVSSVGSDNESSFWPAEPAAATFPQGVAHPPFEILAPPATPPADTFLALAVTCDDYLVVAYARAGATGFLAFDLIAGGEPGDTRWPLPGFAPFDLCPRDGGGLWVLDRAHQRLWELDGKLAVVATGQPAVSLAEAAIDDFQPLAGPLRRRAALQVPGGLDLRAVAGAVDAVALDVTPDGALLLLDVDTAGGRSRVLRLRREAAAWWPEASDWLSPLLAQDFVFGAAPRVDLQTPAARLFITGSLGNQAQAYDLVDASPGLLLRAAPELYPLRRYAGRALLTVRGLATYDSGLVQPRWTQVVQQPRARFQLQASLVTMVLDSGEEGTVWDKVLLDACVPAGTAVAFESRAGDECDLPPAANPAAQVLAGWSPEPAPRLRSEGSELPWLRSESARATRRDSGTGTWELLLQKAQGRYLQLRLVLQSQSGTGTPRLRALRVWSPRFSYSHRFLPAVYREEPAQASFLERWLANFESTFTQVEDRIATLQTLFDARSTPYEALPWLAEWFDLALDPAWDERRHRLFVRHAMDFFRWRGTTHGLRLALALAFEPCLDPALFDGPRPQDDAAGRIRIVEAYQTRLIGALAAGDPGDAADPGNAGPREVPLAALWTPAEGNAGLVDRYAAWLGRTASPQEQIAAFPLVPPLALADTKADAAQQLRWRNFCVANLAFVPAAGAEERQRWQGFLRSRYVTLEQLNQQHASSYASLLAVPLPADLPANPTAAADWDLFITQAGGTASTRSRWLAFLAGRYRRIERLRDAHGTHWLRLDQVPLPDVLPHSAATQLDWLQFERVLLALHRTAHRFSVLLPVSSLSADPGELDQRLALARRIVELEKPAHTTFDVRFFWAFNRVGEARLGLDTQLGAGSRAPELIPDAVVGRAYLGAAFVGAGARPGAGDRLLIDC